MSGIKIGNPFVQIPDLSTAPEAVRRAAERLAELHAELGRSAQRRNRAELAMHNADAGDVTALARALVDGGKAPSPKRQAAEVALDNAEREVRALTEAVSIQYQRLHEAVVANRDEWRASLAAQQRDALAAYEKAAADQATAEAALTASGALLMMLDGGTLAAPGWRPAAGLSIAAQAVADALPTVRADVEAHAPAPVEVTSSDDAELIEVG